MAAPGPLARRDGAPSVFGGVCPGRDGLLAEADWPATSGGLRLRYVACVSGACPGGPSDEPGLGGEQGDDLTDGRFPGVTMVRVIVAVVSVITGGAGVLAYLAAWAIIPGEGEKISIAQDILGKKQNA
jgi:hypothetical protein